MKPAPDISNLVYAWNWPWFKVGWHLTMFFYSNYEVLAEYILKPFAGHQGGPAVPLWQC